MATVKGLYDLIKKEESEGKKLSKFEKFGINKCP